MSERKRFFTSHAKSSAAFISLAVHVLLFIFALSFVTFSVIKKEDTAFVAQTVARPKMELKKLQVPVDIKKQAPKPRLRKRIVVAPKLDRSMPDFQFPEISGVAGGVGGSGQGLGGLSSIGFSMPEVELFGIKRKTERVTLVLDGNQHMALDSLGGARGFEVIKEECIRLIEGLPPTTVFNIIVYGDAVMLFPQMVAATDANVRKAKEWLMPLNRHKGTATRYGVDTLGPGGTRQDGAFPFGVFKEEVFYPRSWNIPVFLSLQQEADTVFLLTGDWGYFGYPVEDGGDVREKWDQTSAGKNWARKVEEGRKALKEENARRLAAGEALSALTTDELSIVRHYYPGTQGPPSAKKAHIGFKELSAAFKDAQRTYDSDKPKTGLKRPEFALNVIYFRPEKYKNENERRDKENDISNFDALSRALRGEFRSIAGLEAIESYVKVK